MSLYVREVGPASAPTIVLLHGGGVSGWMWDPQVEDLRKDYHLLVPDLPEHGRSKVEPLFSLQAAAECVADLIRTRAGDGRATVVGLSLGGQTVVKLLTLAPDVVDRAVMSGTLVQRLPGRALLRPAIALNMPLLKWDWLVRYQARRAGIPPQYVERVKAEALATSLDTMVRIYQENMGVGLPPELARVHVPALVLVGEQEPCLSRSSARRLAHAIPGARGYVVPGVGHTWNLQAPELFNRTLRAWVSDQPLPPELAPLL